MRDMSYSFLSDVFPTWKGGDARTGNGSLRDLASGIDLYENFDVAPTSQLEMPKPQSTSLSGVLPPQDKGLLSESFNDYTLPLETQTGGPGPQPFDTDGDYFKILSEDWEKDTARYQAQARSPFQPKDYAEEGPNDDHGAQPAHGEGCMGVAKHLDGCEECRSRLEHIFRKILHKTGDVKKRMASSNLSSNLIDVMLLVGIGVFVIFVLDAFVKLGRDGAVEI